MDEKKTRELWKRVLGEVETEVSHANFYTLFKPTALLSFENGVATIAAPSSMIVDLLKKRFCQIIKKTLDKHVGTDTNIVFVPKTLNGPTIEGVSGPLFPGGEQGAPIPKEILLPQKTLSRVRADFTFQTLAVSGGNQLAYVSAQTVAKNIGHSYNPLFIYGPVGVGKTHLMQAIANEVFQKNPEKKVIYTTSEEFTNEVVEAIRTNDTARMKKRFRTIDLLIIDDIQFIAGKDRVQEELFHTFNILIDNSSQIVLSSDKPPEEIKKLEKRLSSRFSAGLTVDIEPPDFELRTAILLIKAKKYNLDLPIDIAKAVAQRFEDARSLEGALLRIVTELKTGGGEVNYDFIANFLKDKEKQNHFHPDEIINGICRFYKIKSTLLKSPKRDASLVRARQIAMHLLKKELGLTLVEIGNILGGRDHTTVMHGVKKVENLLSSKNSFSLDIAGITKFLSGEKTDN